MNGTMLRTKLSDDDVSGSSSDSIFSSSPGNSCLLVGGGGSDLFRSVLEDYVTEADGKISKSELNRYKSKQLNKDKNDTEHVVSRRCESCQTVMAFCKCEMYHGRKREFGHRVHWADEVWEKPLKTCFEEHDSHEHCFNDRYTENTTVSDHIPPKPILKHKANCIVVISE